MLSELQWPNHNYYYALWTTVTKPQLLLRSLNYIDQTTIITTLSELQWPNQTTIITTLSELQWPNHNYYNALWTTVTKPQLLQLSRNYSDQTTIITTLSELNWPNHNYYNPLWTTVTKPQLLQRSLNYSDQTTIITTLSELQWPNHNYYNALWTTVAKPQLLQLSRNYTDQTTIITTLSELQWPNHNYYNSLNSHHKATCSSRPERQQVLVWGCTFCECSLSSPPCSPCPFLACSPSNVCIPNVPPVWSSLLIYGAANGTIHPKCYAVIHKPFVLFHEDSAIPYLLPCLIS